MVKGFNCASESRVDIRELEPHEMQEVSGGSLQWSGGQIVGFQFSAGSFSVGEIAVAGGSSYNYWSTPFGSGSYWAN